MRFTLTELAEKLNATLKGDADCVITSLAPLAKAGSGQLSFLVGGKYRKQLQTTQAGAVLIKAADLERCPVNALVVDNPELAFAKVARLFMWQPDIKPGVHPKAVVAKSAQIDPTATIGPYVVIGEHVKIGANTIIKAGSQIEDYTEMGQDCVIHSRVTIYHHCIIGDRVVLHSGVVIGADGFGLTQNNGRWETIPQLGCVIIKNDVDIGANTTIDRGALEDTVIGNGVKLDNQIQIAHNCTIGDHSVMAGASGIAGSTQLGSYCIVGGAAAINGHIKIVDGVIITGMSMVTKSLLEPGVYSSGTGIAPNRKWRRNVTRFQKLDELAKRVKALEEVHT